MLTGDCAIGRSLRGGPNFHAIARRQQCSVADVGGNHGVRDRVAGLSDPLDIDVAVVADVRGWLLCRVWFLASFLWSNRYRRRALHHFRQVTEFAVFAVCLDGEIVGHAFRESIDDPLSDQARVNLVGVDAGGRRKTR